MQTQDSSIQDSSVQNTPLIVTPYETQPEETVTEMVINRTTLIDDMITRFKAPMIVHSQLKFQFKDEIGQDQSGVSREAYSAFWSLFFQSHAEGEN